MSRKPTRAQLKLSFAHQLAQRAEKPNLRKGERTRERLKAAAANLLDKAGYRDMRVSDINEAAGVSNALFYVYFNNKEEITREVLVEFLDQLRLRPVELERDAPAAARIYAGNLEYIAQFDANRGLMRCLLQFSDDVAEFREVWRAWNIGWNERVLMAMQRDPDVAIEAEADQRVAAAALGMMVDGLLRLRFTGTDEHLEAILGNGDHGALALLLTRLWYRALYAKEMDWAPVALD